MTDIYNILFAGSTVDNETIDARWKDCFNDVMLTIQQKISKRRGVINILYMAAATKIKRFGAKESAVVVDDDSGRVTIFE